MTVRFSTSPLGLGLATVMRLPKTADQMRVLDAAYSAGFRHFDVAPAYGLGRAETLLGTWLASAGADVTIATKVGLPPSQVAARVAMVQGPLRRVLAASPRLRGWVKARSSLATSSGAAPSVAQIENSLDQSLREIGRSPDVLLLHEVPASALGDDVAATLRRLQQDGSVSYVGASGPQEVAEGGAARLGLDTVVVQIPVDLGAEVTFAPRRGDSCMGTIRYGLLSRYLHPLTERLCSTGLGRAVESSIGLPLRTKADVASLLAMLALDRWPDDTLLIGSTSHANLERLGAAVRNDQRLSPEALAEVFRRLQAHLQ
ncbi:aldo/keto reductase [Modestobacter sp. VKM Ac-2985]|uniref:aldo/keto reductase n=1 Tax=Modestobacter sp. VKM Ac-2985 TaxID=3004139 RepID=UPI0022ABA92F|nr:aldo/keto reductase [Modestobacter sp. VKM Ac-2985]MCZ2836040.1 aldo/keto reductase [Modestobacter sp. VKM Ac-2985]